MDTDLLMIVTMIVIVTAIIGGSVNGVVQKVLDFKREQNGIKQQSGHHGNLDHETSARSDMIEDRLRVLERLATERGQLLSDEIEALRDRSLEHAKDGGNA